MQFSQKADRCIVILKNDKDKRQKNKFSNQISICLQLHFAILCILSLVLTLYPCIKHMTRLGLLLQIAWAYGFTCCWLQFLFVSDSKWRWDLRKWYYRTQFYSKSVSLFLIRAKTSKNVPDAYLSVGKPAASQYIPVFGKANWKQICIGRRFLPGDRAAVYIKKLGLSPGKLGAESLKLPWRPEQGADRGKGRKGNEPRNKTRIPNSLRGLPSKIKTRSFNCGEWKKWAGAGTLPRSHGGSINSRSALGRLLPGPSSARRRPPHRRDRRRQRDTCWRPPRPAPAARWAPGARPVVPRYSAPCPSEPGPQPPGLCPVPQPPPPRPQVGWCRCFL